jgi:hypothetical protein
VLNGLSTDLFPTADQQKEVILSLENLSTGCSASLLNKVLKLGSIVRQLNEFVSEEYDERSFSRTRFAYISSLQDYLTFGPFRVLHQLTSEPWCASESHFTLLAFIRYLQSARAQNTFESLHTIDRLNSRVQTSFAHPSRCARTVFTLNVLYDSLSTCRSSTQKWVWEMFFSCIRPSLQYLQHFFVNGDFDDPNDEFYFHKNPILTSEHFWDECLNVRIASNVPKVFASHWKYIVIGVRSRLLIAHFDPDFHLKTTFSSNLFAIFVDELMSLMRRSAIGTRDRYAFDPNESKDSGLEIDTDDTIQMASALNRNFELPDVSLHIESGDGKHLKSQELRILYSKQPEANMKHVSPTVVTNARQSHFRGYLTDRSFDQESDSPTPIHSLPLHFMIEKALDKALRSFVTPICHQIMNLFKKKFVHHVQVMNSYYLMQLQGHLLSLFFDRLFTDLLTNPGKCCGKLPSNFDYSNLIDRTEPSGSSHVIAYFSSIQSSNNSNLYFNILSSFYLLYKNIDPITLSVLNASIRQFYHDSFQTLLRFRFCKWICENMRFENRAIDRHCRLVRSKDHQCFHLLFLVRHRLLSLLNTLYSSIMQRIEENVTKLRLQVNEADDYEQIRDSFDNFRHEIELTLSMKKDPKSLLMNNLVESLNQYVFKLRELWLRLETQFEANALKPSEDLNQFDQISFCNELQQMHDYLINNSKVYRCFENV